MNKRTPISLTSARMLTRALNYQLQSLNALKYDHNGEADDIANRIAKVSGEMCDAVKFAVEDRGYFSRVDD